MAKSTMMRKTGPAASDAGAEKPARIAAPSDLLVKRLSRARSANEITNVIGLKPIKGRSGPKIAY